MPSYPGNAQATLLRDNTQAFFWNAETVAATTLSVAFQLERVNRSFYPWGLSVEASFGGDPSVFEIDIMGSNSDKSTNFVQIGAITSYNSSFVGRWDMPSNVWIKYVAAYVKTLTNAVAVTLQVTK